MSSFWRVLRLTLTRRGIIAGILLVSTIIAVLWGGNIGVIYPVIEILVDGKSMHDWVDRKIAASETKIEELDEQLKAAAVPEDKGLLVARRDAEAGALATYRWMRPFVHEYMPATPFHTLLLIVFAHCLVVPGSHPD